MTGQSQPAIRRNRLGDRSGLEVTEIGLGLWAVPGSEWGPAEARDSLEAIEEAFHRGVNFFDTADVYGDGSSEELLGQAMRGRRAGFVVGTKIGWIGFDEQAGRSRYDDVTKVVDGVSASLRRLQTDYLDLIQCHIPFVEPNTDVFIEAFRLLREKGMVRAWGVSTGEISVVQRFNAAGDCDAVQVDYSILNRTAEDEILPYCLGRGIGVIVRGPLAMGLLAGKMTLGERFPEDDFRGAWIADPGQNMQYRDDLETVDRLRDELGADTPMAPFAIRFAASHPAVATVIPGARNRRQAADNSSAGLLPALTEHEKRMVDRIVPPGGGRRIWPA